MPSGEMSGEDLLALYRKRGKAEGHLGHERRGPGPVVDVAPQEPLPGQGDQEGEKGVDAFACNQVRLCSPASGSTFQRAVLERVTGTG